MSLNQLVDPLIPLDVKVGTITAKDVIASGIAISGDVLIEGDAKVDGKISANSAEIDTTITCASLGVDGDITSGGTVRGVSFVSSDVQDKPIVMNSGAFQGQTARVQAERYGEYAFVDVYEHFGPTTATGRAIIQGALDPRYRPGAGGSVTLQCAFVSRVGTGYMSAVTVNGTNGDIIIEPITASGGGVINADFPISATASGWYGFSFVIWCEQIAQGEARAPAGPRARRPFA